jgi:cell division protein FtsQ
MKKTLSIIAVGFFALAVVVLAGYGFYQYRNRKVKKVVVHIHRNTITGFLEQKAITRLILTKDSVLGKQVKDIAAGRIEKQIAQNPFVDKVNVYLNLFGNLMVNVTERKPLLRIYNLKNQSCYVDADGTLFPLSATFVPRVLPVNGYLKADLKPGKNIHDKMYRHSPLPALYLLTKKIAASPFLKANISQLFINSRGHIDMVPELGRYVIHFGDSSQMEVKLENFEAFTKQVFARGGWSKYKSINLAFTNQVVCTKK